MLLVEPGVCDPEIDGVGPEWVLHVTDTCRDPRHCELDMSRLALIHTVTSLSDTFDKLAAELIPDVDVFHIVDESLLIVTREEGSVSPTTKRRVADYVTSAEAAGADVVMVTCSSVGPGVDATQPFATVPLVRVDQAMVDRAVRHGTRIGVLATLSSTLEPTVSLVHRRAEHAGRSVEVVSRICEGAFEAVTSGDTERHDALVREGLLDLIGGVDVVILAQASMARVADQLPESERRVPVLSSPRPAMELVADLFHDASAAS